MRYCLLPLSAGEDQVLFTPCARWLSAACGGEPVFYASDRAGLCASAAALPPEAEVAVFFFSLPALFSETAEKIFPGAAVSGGCLKSADGTLLAGGLRAGALAQAADPASLFASLPEISPCAPEETLVWSAQTLPALSSFLQARETARHIAAGALIPFPSAVFIAPGVSVAPGAQILPGSILRGQTVVAPGAVIGPNSLLEDAVIGEGVTVNSSQILKSTVGKGTTVGPFAYIRPDCLIGENVRVGDFVELKNAHIGSGTKVSHLTYLGDARIGSRVNFGCGTVAVNYDGSKKHLTRVGNDAFIGCNANLVAPVTVEDGAYVAAGSTITEDVPEDALAIARSRQVNKAGWAAQRRERLKK